MLDTRYKTLLWVMSIVNYTELKTLKRFRREAESTKPKVESSRIS